MQVDASKSATTAKLSEPTAISALKASPLQPIDQYKQRNTVDWALPKSTSHIAKPLGAQKMASKQTVKGGWSNAPEGVAKDQGNIVHQDGSTSAARMVVRADQSKLKSKWAEAVAPRPAAPPPLPTNEKLAAGMSVTLGSSDPETVPDALDLVVATFKADEKVAKWRLELRCKGWQRAIGVMAETPTASFKIAGASEKDLDVRGATVSTDGVCSLWTEWRSIPKGTGLTPAEGGALAGDAVGGVEARLKRLEEERTELLARVEAAEARAEKAEKALADAMRAVDPPVAVMAVPGLIPGAPGDAEPGAEPADATGLGGAVSGADEEDAAVS